MKLYPGSITDIPGIRVGHAQNEAALTGCTVILCDEPATGGVDQRGGAPGTRETDLLRPMHLVNTVNAVLLSGGSAFGLDAASGVVKYLEEHNQGINVGVARVPIVPAAILFDLGIGDPKVRPDLAMGYQACQNASNQPVAQGNIGAGAGATVGKLFGMKLAMKSGIGTSSIRIANGVVIGAIIAVNAFGDILDIETGSILAGTRSSRLLAGLTHNTAPLADTMAQMKSAVGSTILHFATQQNTVIGVVATNARLNKEQANKVAQMAHNGLAQAIRPAHTMLDGDTLFCMSTNRRSADTSIVGAFAAQVVAQAINNAARAAHPAGNLPAAESLFSPEAG